MDQNMDQLDKIIIGDLPVACIIGTLPHERTQPQDVIIDLTLWTDLRPAGLSDDLVDTIDYQALSETIVREVSRSSWHLIEKLAQQIATLCLATPSVQRCCVRVTKPNALPNATVAVEITR